MHESLKRIEGRVAGDDWTIRLTVVGIPSGQFLAEAWFTVKVNATDADSAAVVQKHITETEVVGVGEIEDTGSDGAGVIRFDLAPADTILFKPYQTYFWDSQVKTNTGKINTPHGAGGTLTADPQVTYDD